MRTVVRGGRLVTPHAQTDAYRSYLYQTGEDAWDVAYDDGRPFLYLPFVDGVARCTHDCSPDTYRAIYKIRSNDEFLIAFAVSGPRKKYFAVSRLTRV